MESRQECSGVKGCLLAKLLFLSSVLYPLSATSASQHMNWVIQKQVAKSLAAVLKTMPTIAMYCPENYRSQNFLCLRGYWT